MPWGAIMSSQDLTETVMLLYILRTLTAVSALWIQTTECTNFYILIDPSTPYQFRLISNADTQNVAYDYDSVMHYPAWAFQRAAGLYTITPNDASVDSNRLGQRAGLSPNDIQHANIRYCPGT